jgi:hypothetical protein
MALIPLFHVVADEHAIGATSGEIIMGQPVSLDGNGVVVAADNNSTFIYGIAGDTKTSTNTAGIPSTNDAVIGAGNDTRGFVNRVSDPFDETQSSGMMTVYHAGGKFATDQYDTGQTYNPGNPLYVNAGGLYSSVVSASAVIVGYVLSEGEFPTGVPGITIDQDTSFGTFLTFKMV